MEYRPQQVKNCIEKLFRPENFKFATMRGERLGSLFYESSGTYEFEGYTTKLTGRIRLSHPRGPAFRISNLPNYQFMIRDAVNIESNSYSQNYKSAYPMLDIMDKSSFEKAEENPQSPDDKRLLGEYRLFELWAPDINPEHNDNEAKRVMLAGFCFPGLYQDWQYHLSRGKPSKKDIPIAKAYFRQFKKDEMAAELNKITDEGRLQGFCRDAVKNLLRDLQKLGMQQADGNNAEISCSLQLHDGKELNTYCGYVDPEDTRYLWGDNALEDQDEALAYLVNEMNAEKALDKVADQHS